MPPSTETYGASGAGVERHRLDRADLVQREHRRPGDRAARLDRQPRHGDARGRGTRASTIVRSSRGQSRRGRSGRPGSCRRCRTRRRGRARAARRRARRGPARAAPAPAGRPPRTRTVSKICEPMCECRPTSSQRRLRQHPARRRRPPRPSASEKPNFWSSCAVAMYSWVCASTPTVTRTITCGRGVALRGQRWPAARSRRWESTTIRPTPASSARRSSASRLVVAVEPDPRRVEAGPQRDAPARRRCTRRGRSPSSRDPAQRPSMHRNALPA